MKKKWITLISLLLVIAIIAGCGAKNTKETPPTEKEKETTTPKEEEKKPEPEPVKEEPVTVNVAVLKGPTGMGIVHLMEKGESQTESPVKYHVEIAAKADEITPKLIQGNLDMVSVPSNLASVLYNKTEGNLRILAINTLGVLHIVERGDTVNTVEDLKEKTVIASGKGATPEYAFRYILEKNGLNPDEDLHIEWKSEHTEVVAALSSTQGAIGLLPEPFVTTALGKVEGLQRRLDLTKEWDGLQKDEEKPSALVMGVVIARKEFVEANPQAVESFLKDYEASMNFVNENQEEAAALIGKYEIVPEEVALKAIPGCNIRFIKGEEMKEKVSGYLDILYQQNPQAVGGKLPDDAFYYQP